MVLKSWTQEQAEAQDAYDDARQRLEAYHRAQHAHWARVCEKYKAIEDDAQLWEIAYRRGRPIREAYLSHERERYVGLWLAVVNILKEEAEHSMRLLLIKLGLEDRFARDLHGLKPADFDRCLDMVADVLEQMTQAGLIVIKDCRWDDRVIVNLQYQEGKSECLR
jgi:hypothetical protein